ncbi:MAG: stage II sporulation protein M [Candidatus Aminicenantes bacterium]|nr:stage II sporulation protein M [Candidatus Aminicenantes bacterium]
MNNNSPITRFYKDQWKQFREKFLGVFILSAVLFTVTAVLAYIYFLYHPEQAQSVFAKLAEILRRKIPLQSGFKQAIAIFINNSMGSFLALFLGLVPFLFLPILSIISNGTAMGIVSAVSAAQGLNPSKIFISIAPHGLLELPALFYAAGLGIYISREIIKHLLFQEYVREPFIPLIRKIIITFLAVILPLLLIAALIESFITPALIKIF